MKTKNVTSMLKDNAKVLNEDKMVKGIQRIDYLFSKYDKLSMVIRKSSSTEYTCQLSFYTPNRTPFTIIRKGTNRGQAMAKAGLRAPIKKHKL